MPANPIALSPAQIAAFIADGFIRIDDAFSRAVADECRTILWSLTGCDPNDRTTWTKPVIRINACEDAPFSASANTHRLHIAFNQLVGRGRWEPRFSMGTFPIRFPSDQPPGDDGWHIDVSYGWEERPTDFLSWRANIFSKNRALLMLFLYSDVGEDDAPTRIRVGSHQVIARKLAPAGEAGLSLREISDDDYASTAHLPELAATGTAGTVYLCHPFLVHAAQPHRGMQPKFMAQPPLGLIEPLLLDRDAGSYSPVERAIRLALDRA
jgi:hypothetical protein